jgi:hypothetical protein
MMPTDKIIGAARDMMALGMVAHTMRTTERMARRKKRKR